ncbi:MAG: porin [Gemmatimonadales bacterium]|nr:porin [Gemmatimonadales bacterium]
MSAPRARCAAALALPLLLPALLHAQARLPVVGEGPVQQLDDGGIRWRTTDRRFEVRARALVQFDGRALPGGALDEPSGGFLLRRSRLLVEGSFGRRLAFRVMPEFGNGVVVLEDAFADVTFGRGAWLRAGRMRTPFGQERARLIIEQLFAERSLASQLTSNRDNGAQLTGELANGRLEYTVGVFNGGPDNQSLDRNPTDAVDVTGRVAWAFRLRRVGAATQGMALGLNGTTGDQRGTANAPFLGTYRTSAGTPLFAYRADGTSAGTTLAAGTRTRWGAFAWVHEGPFGFNAEYVQSRQALARGTLAGEVTHEAWMAHAAWTLTGEPSSGNLITPAKPFDPDAGQWGAFQLVARISRLSLDPAAFPVFADPATQARAATAWAAGLNWYVTRLTKALVYYEQTRFTGGLPGGDRPDERVVGIRLQLML